MPSIFDMFGAEGLEGEGGEAPFDPSNLEAVLDQVIADRPVAGRPPGFETDPSAVPVSTTPSSDGEAAGVEDGDPGAQALPPPGAPASPPSPPEPLQPAATTPPPAPVTPAVDPFAGASDLERQEALAILQALRDPERQMAVRRAYLGVTDSAPAAPAAAPPAPPAPPALPEEIEPGSIEAQLWMSNQELRSEMAAMRQGQVDQRAQDDAQVKNNAAVRATRDFASKYAGRLTQQEIEAVCQTAGMRGLPDTLRPSMPNWDAAMDEALEYTLRSNDMLLAKVLGVAAPPGTPTPAGTRTPEAVQRGRALTALSSAASPSGDTVTRQPLEHRGDGKLTERSRLQLVQEMFSGGAASALRGSPDEGIS
jgi:hypothetical protein